MNNKITAVISTQNQKIKFDANESIALGLQKLAFAFPDAKIVWCHSNYKGYLNLEVINTVFYHNKMILSYCPDLGNYLGEKMGYVEGSPFIKIRKDVRYPTWQMSSVAGLVHASFLIAIKSSISVNSDFDYYINSVAKLCMPLGMLCYSEPQLLKHVEINKMPKANIYLVFRFVKQHYKTQWAFLLGLNLLLYERKFPILPFLCSLFYKNRSTHNINFDNVTVESSRENIGIATVDVIIPTIGRRDYLHNVLMDLKKQTHLPSNIIIVEQNPDEGSESELNYLTNEIWPFAIKHIFTHQVGACNARNLALEQISSEWVFFADDDIRLENNLIQKAFEEISKYAVKAVSVKCFQKDDFQKKSVVFQWITFGSGCSFVFSDSLKNCKFMAGYEFGFGEDGDFGMQLRNQGYDVLYLPEPKILHLKAPVGGFRTKPVLRWKKDKIQPKPSPTIMLYQILHNTKEQVWGYKTTLFIKYYKHQKIRNPLRYFWNFKKQWNQSLFWANELKKVS